MATHETGLFIDASAADSQVLTAQGEMLAINKHHLGVEGIDVVELHSCSEKFLENIQP